jgi:hypothetical protein
MQKRTVKKKGRPEMYWNLPVIMIDFGQDVKQDLSFLVGFPHGKVRRAGEPNHMGCDGGTILHLVP